ncbi:MAG: hypothetical protein ABIN79_00910 [Marmoricola sp.]
MKPVPSFVAMALAAVVLSGCGGPPSDASQKEFCAQLKKVNTEKSWKATKEAVGKLEEIGTPKGISDSAREGFVELAATTKKSSDREGLLKSIEGLNASDRKQLTAFNDYVTKACAGS